MSFFKKRGALTIIGLLLLCTGLATLYLRLRADRILAHDAAPRSSHMSGFPKIFLWAWERPENLEFINPKQVGVAFLARTIYLRGNQTIARPRLQPLKVPAGTTLIAVVRIEVQHQTEPLLSTQQRAEIVEALLQSAQQQNVAALQIDFDATGSEREFYRELLFEVRRRLPESMPLSITALASWCIFDNWLDELPVDEAVPMFFSMGADSHRVNNYLATGGGLRAPLCKASLGVSTDEPLSALSTTSRIYIFNQQAWTEQSVRLELERNLNEKLVP